MLIIDLTKHYCEKCSTIFYTEGDVQSPVYCPQCRSPNTNLCVKGVTAYHDPDGFQTDREAT